MHNYYDALGDILKYLVCGRRVEDGVDFPKLQEEILDEIDRRITIINSQLSRKLFERRPPSLRKFKIYKAVEDRVMSLYFFNIIAEVIPDERVKKILNIFFVVGRIFETQRLIEDYCPDSILPLIRYLVDLLVECFGRRCITYNRFLSY